MGTLLVTTGLVKMNQTNLLILVTLVFFSCVIMGWLSDTLLGSLGFGAIVNTLLLFLWLAAGIAVYTTFIKQIRMEAPVVIGLVAFGSALGGLLLSAIIKRLLIRSA